MYTIQGKGVSGGVANGPLCFYQRGDHDVAKHEVADTEAEKQRFESARQTAMEQLKALYEKALAEVGEEGAELFEAHQMMLDDLDYVEGIQDLIDGEQVNAEYAVSQVAEQFAQMFASMDDSYMQARAADVKDISNRVIGILSGAVAGGIDSDVPVILAADDLAPSETVQLDKSKILGFVAQGGSGNSHTAILARTMGIPAVIGTGDALREDYEGKTAWIDGETGELFVEADEITHERLSKKHAKQRAMKELMDQLKGKENVTIDGRKVMVYCNIGSPDDVDQVLANDGGGIGLFRSEFLYLQNNDYPTEEQQFQAYKMVAERMGGKRVIIRTLDIGADKQAGYFDMPPEDNPALGLRAIRLCLTRPILFQTQLCAILRASRYGNVGIMFPMVTGPDELHRLKEALADAEDVLIARGERFGPYRVGVMIETPAAVFMSGELAGEVDFFSIGTNDLTQYLLAMDRQNPNLAPFCDPHHPAVLRAIRQTVERAHQAGCTVGICGELAADESLTEAFLRLGVDELSVAPSRILPLRQKIRDLTLG